MFCVIQEVKIKEIPNGEAREIEDYTSAWTINGVTHTSYEYRMAGGYYDRLISTAYRISIYESYRE